MPLNFPENRKEISERIKSDVKGQLPESNPYLRNSFLQAMIFGLAGRLFDIYKLAKSLLRNLFWNTSEDEFLEIQAGWFGIRRLAAIGSTGGFSIEGIATTIIPNNTQFQSSDGLEFQTVGASTVSDITTTISTLTQVLGVATATTVTGHNLAPNISIVISGATEPEYNGTFTVLAVVSDTVFQYAVDSGATSPAGGSPLADYTLANVSMESVDTGNNTNLIAGTPLTITNPIAGIDGTGFVQFDGFQEGADTETDEALRSRFLFRVQNPVALFNSVAIELQARLINGVTRVFVFNVDTTKRAIILTSITRSGDVATVVSTSPHLLQDGQKVTIIGATEPEYNVLLTKIIIIDSSTFAYAVAGTPSSPATGGFSATASVVEEGQVEIFFTRDNDAVIIPSASEVDTVKASILKIKPAHVSDQDVIVAAPIAVETNYVFTSITPDTQTMRTAIESRLKQFYESGTNVGETIIANRYNSAIISTVDTITGDRLIDFTLSTPTGDIPVVSNELATLGDLSF